jgi:lipopolysaccharide/colanic/teichoic acid biosynthesis glycosyltransferase
VTKKIYFALTNGRNMVLSRAEMLGRLYSCGFSIVAESFIKPYSYFVVKKIKKPAFDTNASYGPIYRMKRIGKNGKIIKVYKFRTMHPYSEYLQEYVYETNKLDEGGKFKNDFRITEMGRFFRKFWLDELPMFYNLIKGDLKLFGVRPLSEHYLSLYTEGLIQRRRKYKPGLVPPYYVDMPKTIEEIMASEEKYMDAYDKTPFTTDFKYFFKAMGNILFKKARSR